MDSRSDDTQWNVCFYIFTTREFRLSQPLFDVPCCLSLDCSFFFFLPFFGRQISHFVLHFRFFFPCSVPFTFISSAGNSSFFLFFFCSYIEEQLLCRMSRDSMLKWTLSPWNAKENHDRGHFYTVRVCPSILYLTCFRPIGATGFWTCELVTKSSLVTYSITVIIFIGKLLFVVLLVRTDLQLAVL